MPAVNETWVRRVGLSKMTATARGPVSGVRMNRSSRNARASSRTSLCSRGREVVVAQEVPGHDSTVLRETRREEVDELPACSAVSRNGGARRIGRRGARVDDEARLERARGDRGGHGRGELDADEEPLAAHLADERVARCPPAARAACAPSVRDVVEEPVALDHRDGREPGGRRDRVPAERGAVLAATEQRRGPLAVGDERADGEPAAEPLRHGHRVGHDAAADVRELVGEPGAGPAHAGLHLVEDQQRAVLGRELAGERQVAGRERPDAGLALDRLDEQRGDLVAVDRERGLERLGVAERHELDAARAAARTARGTPPCG